MLTEANLSEFHGYGGDCGWLAVMGALHGLDPAHYAMTSHELDAIVQVALKHGQSGTQGQATISELNWMLTYWLGCQTRVYGYTDGELAGWQQLLAEHAGVHPVILELRHGGKLHPANDPALWYHYVTQLNSGDFVDGDHAAGTGEGAMNRYTASDLEAATVCGAIVVYNTAPMRQAGQPTPTPKPARHYVIKAGDTLSKIAAALTLTSWYGQLYKPNMGVIEAAAKAHGRSSSSMGQWIYPGTVLSY